MFAADRHRQQQQRINNAAAAAANDLRNNTVQQAAAGTSAVSSSSSSLAQRPEHEIRMSTEHLVQSTTYCLAYKLLTLGDMDFDHRVASLRSSQAQDRLKAMAFEYLKATSRLGERGEHMLMEIEKEEDIEKIHFVKLAVWKAQCLLELPTATAMTTLQQPQQTHIQPQERKDGSGDVMMTTPSSSSALSSTTTAVPRNSGIVASSAGGGLPTIRSYYDILAWQKEGWKSKKQVVLRTCIKSTIIAKRVLPFLIGEEKKKIEEEEDEEEDDDEEDDDDDEEDDEDHHDDEMDEEDDEDGDDEDEEEGDEEIDNDDDDDEIDHDAISDDEGGH